MCADRRLSSTVGMLVAEKEVYVPNVEHTAPAVAQATTCGARRAPHKISSMEPLPCCIHKLSTSFMFAGTPDINQVVEWFQIRSDACSSRVNGIVGGRATKEVAIAKCAVLTLTSR